MADILCDGLYFAYLCMKLSQEVPETFKEAVKWATRKQHFRKPDKITLMLPGQQLYLIRPRRGRIGRQRDPIRIHVEPMEIDCMRKQICECRGSCDSPISYSNKIERSLHRVSAVGQERKITVPDNYPRNRPINPQYNYQSN